MTRLALPGATRDRHRRDMMGLRSEAPELWRGIVGWCREIGIDWPEDDIAAVAAKVCKVSADEDDSRPEDDIAVVIAKVRASDPDSLPGHIGRVLEWCREAERQQDDDALADVALWRTPRPIEIFVGADGEITHRLDAGREGGGAET